MFWVFLLAVVVLSAVSGPPLAYWITGGGYGLNLGLSYLTHQMQKRQK